MSEKNKNTENTKQKEFKKTCIIKNEEEKEEEEEEDSETAESSANDVEETIVMNENEEAKEAEKLIQTQYGGNVPEVGIGYQHYLEKLDEIERKAKGGFYEFELQVKKKKKKYENYKVKIIEKKNLLDKDDPNRKKYVKLLKVLNAKLIRLEKLKQRKERELKNA
jgi:hypothetical protein